MRRRWLGVVLAGLVAAVGLVAAPSPAHAQAQWSFESRGRLGIGLDPINGELRQHFGAPADRGLLVAHVEPGSDAAAAGLQVGDVVVEVAGAPVRDAGDVTHAVAGANKGDQVALSVVRAGKPLALTATMTDDPMPARVAPDPARLDDMRRNMERTVRGMMKDMPWFQNVPEGMQT